ncbi:MAG: hypothetical protein KatS3mg002_1169 [Candidatus Woesearchaeota archaeon]|nr:MAG: hypothetical protein KatS3mg002_1169 [Candidatus Woesearchaeota archaeon]
MKKNDKNNEEKNKKDNDTPVVVEAGHFISVEYTGSLDDGEEFDSSKNNGPISFVVGSGQVIKGFDDAVIGMKINESKRFKVKKEDAYGDINPDLIHKVPLDKIPEDMRKQIKEGGFLIMQTPIGQQIPAKVQSITDSDIFLDLNHPLAGKDLTFDITIKEISTNYDDYEGSHNHHGHNHEHDHEHTHEHNNSEHTHEHNHYLDHRHSHNNSEEDCGCDEDCDCDCEDQTFEDEGCCGGGCNCK